MSGTLLAMPMLVINMGGEMVYILEQRLRAQNIPKDKSSKVLSDVVKTMYSRMFIRELFKPQALYSSHSTRQIFDRLAHSSIMRLNKNSMDKLYDLMTMGFKHQMLSCASPTHLMQVTLNHLESLVDIVDNAAVSSLIQDAISLTRETYGSLPLAEFFALKQTLCRFFQDRRVKVSLFLQDGSQNMDGTIVLNAIGPLPVGSDPVGTVVYHSSSGATVTRDLPDLHIAEATKPNTGDPFDREARPCKFGLNMYAKERSKTTPNKPPVRMRRGAEVAAVPYLPSRGDVPSSKLAEEPEEESKGDARGTATAGLNLLASLIGADEARASAGPSTLNISNLFAEDIFSSESKTEAAVITIDATDRSAMEEMMRRIDLGDGGGGKESEDADEDDLLALMDSAN